MPKTPSKNPPEVNFKDIIKTDPIPSLNWLPPPDKLGEKLLAAVEYKPLEEKDIFGLKVSRRALKNLSPYEIRDLAEVFQTFDRNLTGYLKANELYYALKVLGFSLTQDFIGSVSQEADENGVSFNQFLDIIIDKQGTSHDHYEEILNGFKLFDYDNTEHITFENLRKACTEAELPLSDNDIKEMIQEADQNGDGLIDQSEFVSIMLKTNLY